MEFVGRTGLLEQVKSHFDQLDNRRCLLAGDGGKGKPAVAYRYAQQLADAPGRFQLIVWLSAKRRRFQEGKVVSIDSPDVSTVDDAVNRLLSEYGAVMDDFSKPLEERKRLLLDYLNSYPAFIVGDDIDTLLEDSDVVSLFTYEIPHTQSAVLLTSRRDIPGVRSYVVKGFEKDEAESFIRSRVHLYGLDGQQFTPQVISELVKVTDGSPLYMDDLLRLTRIVDVRKALSTWAERRGDEARKYALQREMERLSQDGKKILVAAAVTDGPISYAELESILEMSEDRLLSALSELQTLFLFPKPKVIEAEQRFDINLNTKKLVRLVEGQSDFYARIERASKMLRGQMPEVVPGMVGALIRQAQLRLNADRYQESEQILLEALDKYPQSLTNSPERRLYRRRSTLPSGRLSWHPLRSARRGLTSTRTATWSTTGTCLPIRSILSSEKDGFTATKGIGTASINDAIEYYGIFERAQAEKQNGDPSFVPLNIAAVFSPPADVSPDVKQIQEDLPQEQEDNKHDPERKKQALMAIIAGYNGRFGTNHRIEEFDLYYQDVQKRIIQRTAE